MSVFQFSPTPLCELPLVTYLHINCFKYDVPGKFLIGNLFKIHERFRIFWGKVETPTNALTLKKVAGVFVRVLFCHRERASAIQTFQKLCSFFVCISKNLLLPFSPPISLFLFLSLYLSPSLSLSLSMFISQLLTDGVGTPCPLRVCMRVGVCVHVSMPVSPNAHDQYSGAGL